MELLLIISLLLSGFFAGSETVFLSVQRIRLEGFLHKKLFGARSARWFLIKPSRFVLTTLVGNNLANIAFTSVLTAYLIAFDVSSGWITLIAAIIILVFGEIIPKSLGRDLADKASLRVAPVLRFFQWFLYPLIYICNFISSFILKLFGISPSEVQLFFTRSDLKVLIHEGAKNGALETKQESRISSILKYRDMKADEVMTPRTEIVALEESATLDDLRETTLSSGYSKIPVYRQDIDHIVGVAYARDLFGNPEGLKQITRTIPFFPEQKNAWEIFKEFRTQRQHIAVIVDEWGGTAGLVTLEDLIEEFVGEIEDEYDREADQIWDMGNGCWTVSARVEIEELNEKLKVNIPEGDYETLGGYLIENLGRIPKRGEIIELDGYRFKIIRTTKTKIRVVELSLI